MEKLWLGNNYLGIRYNDELGWVVKEFYEDWEVVFSGSYEECYAYCEQRWISYEESIIG